MPVFTQYTRAMTPLTGTEVLMLGQTQNGNVITCTTTTADLAAMAGNLTLNFQTVAAMTAAPPFFIGFTLIAHVAGYNVPNDGGGGLFYWDPLSTATADNVVTFQVTGAATGRWIRILQDDATINVMMAGAWGDGIHDDTAAIQAAINYLVVRGGGQPGFNTNTSGGRVVIQNFGQPYLISSQITYYSYISIIGEGMPTIRLNNNAGTSVLESFGFQGNIVLPNSSGGIQNVVIKGLILDGNSANQPTNADPTLNQNGLSFYGFGWIWFEDLVIMNTKGCSMRCGGGTGTATPNGLYIPYFANIQMLNAGCHGWELDNLHDTVSENVVIVNASQNQDGGYYGFYNKTSGRHKAVHVWTNLNDASVVNFPAYALYSTGFGEYVACHFESCKQSAKLTGPYDRFVNCLFYNPGKTYVANTAFVDIASHDITITNAFLNAKIKWTGAATYAAQMYAFNIAASGLTNIWVDNFTCVDFDQCGPLNFANACENYRFVGAGYVDTPVGQMGSATSIGNPAAMGMTGEIRYMQNGNLPWFFNNGFLVGCDNTDKNIAKQVRFKAVSTSGVTARATLDGQAANFANTFGIRDNTVMTISIVCAVYGANGGSAVFNGGPYLIRRTSGPSSIFIVGGQKSLTLVTSNGTTTGWGATVNVDTTLGSLDIECTGDAGDTVTFDLQCSITLAG